MIDYEQTKIRLYEILIRDIINSIVQKIDFEKLDQEGKSFKDRIMERFRFDSNKGWQFLIACLDTLGDSNFAIVTFLNKGIENGEEFNTEEKYLRLYGVLSAVQIQQHSILKLADLVKLNGIVQLMESFKGLDISFLRHSISAHPVNFNDNGKKVSFRIDRFSLNDSGNLNLRNEDNSFKEYNIFNALKIHIYKVETTLESIIEKMIDNLYSTSEMKKSELRKELSRITMESENTK